MKRLRYDAEREVAERQKILEQIDSGELVIGGVSKRSVTARLRRQIREIESRRPRARRHRP